MRQAFLTAVLLLAGMGAARAQGHQADPFAARLPDGPGKEDVLELCAGACHQSDKILTAHKSPAEWRQTVLQMARNGAQLLPDDVDSISSYLSAHFAAAEPGK